MKVGRNEGKHPKQIDFERAQILKAIGIKEERMNLKASTSIVSSQASEVVLGAILISILLNTTLLIPYLYSLIILYYGIF